VLQASHELVRTGRTSTQRDLYYRLKAAQSGLFKHPRDVGTAIQDVIALLRVPRASLGITCAARGAVAGALRIRDHDAAPWQDCTSLGKRGGVSLHGLKSLVMLDFCR
jgi:DNA topoisomerase VI subunit A